MKNFFFKNSLSLSFFLILGYIGNINAQPTVSPSPNTEIICPSNANALNNVLLTFNFGGTNWSNYSIVISSLKGCTVIRNIDDRKEAVVQFSDKKETHEFKVYYSVTGSIVGTYTYTKIKTLDGVKAAFSGTLPVNPPQGYDDILTSDVVGQCKTATFHYTSPPVKYKDASGVAFGTNPMNIYEWVVPKGWKVYSSVSDGFTPINGTPSADITPDPLTSGEFKIRAVNNCNSTLTPSTWFKVSLDRPMLNLKVVSDKFGIACGEQNPVNFSIGNASTISCMNLFTWNINPGWLLSNGSPAPLSYSTGTINNLTLIPDCGKALGSVSGTVTANGVNYLAIAFSVPTNPLGLSISGSGVVGKRQNYNIAGLPCNASVVWSVSPLGIVDIGCTNCPQVNLSRITDGDIILKAVITACGVPEIITKSISVCNGNIGIPANLSATISSKSYYYGYYLYFTPVPDATSYLMEWYDLTDNRLLNTYPITNTGQFYYYFTTGHTYKYRLAANLSCGLQGDFSAWSEALFPPPASCENGPINSTLMQTLGCGGSSCTYSNISWPSIAGSSQYTVQYNIVNIGTGINLPTGTITTAFPNATVYYSALSGTGWTISYRVSVNCGGIFGNYSGWSASFFLQ